MSKWSFGNWFNKESYKPDSDWSSEEDSGLAMQPDHFPNVARPGGGFPEGEGEKSGVNCKTCNQNELVDGSCPLCDWGRQNNGTPGGNYPQDPYGTDMVHFRSKVGHWDFGDDKTISIESAKGDNNKIKKEENLKLLNKNKDQIVEKFREIYEEKNAWVVRKKGFLNEYVDAAREITKNKSLPSSTIRIWWSQQKEKINIQTEFNNTPLKQNFKLLDDNKDQIVEKFREIYEKHRKWNINNSPQILDEYFDAVKNIINSDPSINISRLGKNTITRWWNQQEEKRIIEDQQFEIKQKQNFKLLDDNKDQIVEKFREIYEKIGSWRTTNSNLGDIYIQAIKTISGLENVLQYNIIDWWNQQDEKGQIEKDLGGKGNHLTEKRNKAFDILDKNKDTIDKEFDEIYKKLLSWGSKNESLAEEYVIKAREITGDDTLKKKTILDWLKERGAKKSSHDLIIESLNNNNGGWDWTPRVQEGKNGIDESIQMITHRPCDSFKTISMRTLRRDAINGEKIKCDNKNCPTYVHLWRNSDLAKYVDLIKEMASSGNRHRSILNYINLTKKKNISVHDVKLFIDSYNNDPINKDNLIVFGDVNRLAPEKLNLELARQQVSDLKTEDYKNFQTFILDNLESKTPLGEKIEKSLGSESRFKTIFPMIVREYDKIFANRKEQISERMVWDHLTETLGFTNEYIVYIITSGVAIKFGISSQSMINRLIGYEKQNQDFGFKDNPERQWQFEEKQDIPMSDAEGSDISGIDPILRSRLMPTVDPNQLSKEYERDRRIVRSSQEKLYWVSQPMDKQAAQLIEQRIVNWLRNDCNIQSSPIGEDRTFEDKKFLPYLVTDEGEEKDVEHMTETIPINNKLGITPELIAYFAQIMSANGGQVPNIGPENGESIKRQFNISDENFAKVFSGKFGQELGLYNFDEKIIKSPLEDFDITDPSSSAWNFDVVENSDYFTRPTIDEAAYRVPLQSIPDLPEDIVKQPQKDPNQMQLQPVVDEELVNRQSKTADVEGYSNWETFNTAMLLQNEQAIHEYVMELVKKGGTSQDLANWALITVVGPYNQKAIQDAQTWNEVPYEERPTGKENMEEGTRDLTNQLDEIFGFEDNRADAVATTINESLINWDEIHSKFMDDIKEDEEWNHNDGEHREGDPTRHPLCPICNPEKPDAPGDTTIPEDWTF